MPRAPAAIALVLGLAALGAAEPPVTPQPGPGGGAIDIPPAGPKDATAEVTTWAAPDNGAEPRRAADALSADPAARGRYLADAGDCRSCHTNPGGAPFAGARPIGTPFGAIYSANITPDRETGIGAWTAEDFYKAMHDGVRPGGARLYPAFPYPHFTKLARADDDALYAYLRTVAPVAQKKPPNKLPFPLNIRFVLRIWNALYFRPGAFQPDPARSAQWNRGAYLVQGPGHCGACHTPMNVLGAEKTKQALQGGKLDDWVSVNLTGAGRDGLASWSPADIVEYLRTGRNAQATASGLMQEVVYESTSRMSDQDLAAVAVYLKGVPGREQDQAIRPADAATLSAGAAIYVDLCAACHKTNGEGTPRLFPPLKGDASLHANDPSTIVRIILEGSRSVPTPGRPTPLAMPGFAWKLSDQQVASVASFVRASWGNAADVVSAPQVARLRQRHSAPGS